MARIPGAFEIVGLTMLVLAAQAAQAREPWSLISTRLQGRRPDAGAPPGQTPAREPARVPEPLTRDVTDESGLVLSVKARPSPTASLWGVRLELVVPRYLKNRIEGVTYRVQLLKGARGAGPGSEGRLIEWPAGVAPGYVASGKLHEGALVEAVVKVAPRFAIAFMSSSTRVLRTTLPTGIEVTNPFSLDLVAESSWSGAPIDLPAGTIPLPGRHTRIRLIGIPEDLARVAWVEYTFHLFPRIGPLVADRSSGFAIVQPFGAGTPAYHTVLGRVILDSGAWKSVRILAPLTPTGPKP